MNNRRRRLDRLREQAMSVLSTSGGEPALTADVEALIHELHVHQVELELQNDTLLETQAELAESRSRYQALFEEAPVGYLVLDSEGRVLQANRAASDLLGCENKALLDRRLQVFVPDPDQVRDLNRHLELTFACGDPQECELALRQGAEGRVHAHLHSQATETRTQPPRCRTTLSDVSASKEAEAALRRLNEDLEERTRRLEASMETSQLLERRLREAERLEAVGRLAGGVAHDFNNMLAIIMGGADLALEQLQPEHPARKNLARVVLASERSAKLTAQLLAFGRRQLLAPREVDLTTLVQETRALLDSTLGPTIRESFTPPLERVAVKADPTGLQQALINLLLNARQAMPEGGDLQLSLRILELDEESAQLQPGASSGRYAVLSVRDTGVGLSPGDRERIFEPFFSTKEGGTGLGLASVHGFVSQSGGFVTVESAPSMGTTFHLHFPALNPCLEPTALLEPAASEAPPAAKPAPLGSTILLVDDEPNVRELFATILRRGGFEVRAFESAEEALEAYGDRRESIDLAVLDVRLPGMNGVELAKRLCKTSPDLPIIFASGYAAEDLELGQGFKGRVLQKPFSTATLLTEIQHLLTH